MRFSKKKGRQIASALAPKSIASIETLGCKAKINIRMRMNSTMEEDVSTQKIKPY